ncbi:uncharacterized protein B4U79_04701 [Dinothrombium tinctorium]|uniref:Uncharacterized protein n=1 Tax=Dinothrombium tinctorium TaxID=1965070 RepID=A0A443QHT0_9ACAR|nr:uncharacterized protein B4U79_04701 [Dinothrombium tinctorium]
MNFSLLLALFFFGANISLNLGQLLQPQVPGARDYEAGEDIEGYIRKPRILELAEGGLDCVGAGAYANVPGMDGWCNLNCGQGFCPPTHCSCA